MRRLIARMSAAAIALCLLSGCDGGEPEARPPTRIINPFNDQLKALPDDLQHLALMRAIRDNGRRCRRVDGAEYQRDYGQMALWVAVCEGGRLWAVFIAPNGDTQVRECTEMEQLRLPQCRPVSPAPAEPATKS
jgi:hypothetical protein